MSHQLELEKKKYRNWVRGGLAYKYLKEGIEGFADDVVQQEHTRILSAVNHTPGLVCSQCCLGNLRPKHQFQKDHAGRKKCPWGQKYCNCMFQNKQQCPNNICEAIMEEILNCHGSTPPAPKWENTDIQKWCSSPWEIGKCFINAKGYSKATKAADIDASGLLHVFINNKILHSHLACSMSGRNIFVKTRERRNTLFHSPTMEMEDTELIECIDGIIDILEDTKELNAIPDAQEAVSKLKQLKQQDFNITTHNEVEVCRAALDFITKKSEELTQSIKDAKDDIDMKQAGATKAIDDKMQTALKDAKDDIDMKQAGATKAIDDKMQTALKDAKDNIDMEQAGATKVLDDKMQTALKDVKDDIDMKQAGATKVIDDKMQTTLKDAKDGIDMKQAGATKAIDYKMQTALKDAKDGIDMKQAGASKAIDDKMQTALKDAEDDIDMKQAGATKAINDKMQTALKDAEDDIDMKQARATKAIDYKMQTALKDAKDGIDMKQAGASKAIDDKMQTALKDAEDDIDMKQARATKAIDDKMQTALQDAREALANHSDIQTLKHAVELLNKRVNGFQSGNSALRQDISFIKQRLIKIEHNIDTLEAARDETTKKLKYVEEKEELRKRLVKLYRNHYVSTSISPLKSQQNNINVKEVYVAPEMVVESDQNATEQVEPSPNKPYIKTLNGYREILQTNGQKHKQIYIVGNVGTGKSTFCKIMIQHWCTAVTEECPIPSNNDKTENPHTSAESLMDIYPENENINEMKNFDFLFFVPLQRMSGLSDITEMIKAIVTDANLASADLVDRIFEEESERCLIVVDGLDEWTTPRNKYLLPHVSYGLPKRDRAKHATIVTLSRPSAKGILSMKSSECDQKVELLGIKRKSIKPFIERYLLKFSKTDLSYLAFNEKIEKAKLEHLEKTPLLLQQLVWLYCTGNEIGKSISHAYCHIVNIMLGWFKNKEEVGAIDESRIGEDRNRGKDVQLPSMLQRFQRCKANKRFLLLLAGVAFEALTSEKGSSTFSRSYLHTKGVSDDAIAELIKLGILNEDNCFDPTEENTQLEFIHISYLEFFAAVHVSSHRNEDQQKRNTVKDLFLKCKSAAEILQLSNVLKMICGLSPSLIPELSKLISEIVSRDESMISYRSSISWHSVYKERQVPTQIQRLILKCLSENDSDDQQMVSLCDVIKDYDTEISFLQRIIPENVLSLYGHGISNEEVWRWIAGLKQLQYMYISSSHLSHSEVVLLLSMIQEAPLKYLSLYLVDCTKSDCDDHNIDLSKHDQLQTLVIDGVKVKISNINTDNLEMLRLASSNTLDINLLLNASKLTELCLSHPYTSPCKYTKQVNSVVHTLTQLRELRLRSVDIDDSALTVTPEMRNLKYIGLWRVSISQKTWCTFVDSLLTLHQSVQVDTEYCSVCSERNRDGRNYVRQNKMFEVIKNKRWYNFSFRSKK